MDAQSLKVFAIHSVLGILIYSILGTAVSAPIAKFYAPEIPLYRHAIIALWAFARGFLVFTLISVPFAAAPQIESDILLWLILLGTLCGIGWLISHDLKRYGVERRGPGIGGRAIFGVAICLAVIAGLHLVISLFFVQR